MKTKKMDMAVLRHARTFGRITVWLPARASGGTVMSVGTVSEADQLGACKRLADRELMQLTGEAPGRGVARKSVTYEITDAGRQHLRRAEGLPDLTVDAARVMNASDLERIWGDHSMARQQLALRSSGGAIVRGALVACGESHSGTGGWWVIPYVTLDREIGYVDIANGCAYLTGVRLDAEQIEALTAPGQTPGPKASWATAWSSPDAGAGKSTEAPDGWTQLLTDIRTHERVEEIEAREPALVAYGLVTCYSHRRGDPSAKLASEWPLDDEQRERVQRLAGDWLDSVRERIGADPGYPFRQGDSSDVAQALFTHDTINPTLREHGVTWAADAAGEYGLYAVAGARRIDAIKRALEAALIEQLTPVMASLPLALRYDDGRGDYRAGQAAIHACAAGLLRRILQPFGGGPMGGEVEALRKQLRAILYERGAIVTEAGRGRGVTCSSPPAKPTATQGEISGREVWRVPFGAECPEEFSHCLLLTVDHELRCRPDDASSLTRSALGMASIPDT